MYLSVIYSDPWLALNDLGLELLSGCNLLHDENNWRSGDTFKEIVNVSERWIMINDKYDVGSVFLDVHID